LKKKYFLKKAFALSGFKIAYFLEKEVRKWVNNLINLNKIN